MAGTAPKVVCLFPQKPINVQTPENNLAFRTQTRPPRTLGCYAGTRPVPAGRELSPARLWQREREILLQQACKRVKGLAARHGVLKAIRIVSRSLNGRQLKFDPVRKLKLAPKTLTGLYYAWRNSGEKASVFRLKFVCKHSVFGSLVIAKFADFLIEHPHRPFESNWNIFSSRRSNFRGGWRPAKRAVRAALTKAADIQARILAASTVPK